MIKYSIFIQGGESMKKIIAVLVISNTGIVLLVLLGVESET